MAAPDADCSPRYGTSARIQASVYDAGGFSYAFVVPVRTVAGDAVATVAPYTIHRCDDKGRNNRVAGSGDVLLERVSRVIPLKPLAITR